MNIYKHSTIDIKEIKQNISQSGAVLLRGHDTTLERFSALMHTLCSRLNFDPARDTQNNSTQKVDAGKTPVGLHIENGNTPMPPEIVAFYSKKSASFGSQTTWCDGVELYDRLPKRLQRAFEQPIRVTRTISSPLWQKFVIQNLHLDESSQVNNQQLQQLMARSSGQEAELDQEGNCRYTLTIFPIQRSPDSNRRAFANALLGPSFNYETPRYYFADGNELSEGLLNDVREIAESCTHEIQWQDGDVLILDNKRIMHGRREITVPLDERELFIGMGMLQH